MKNIKYAILALFLTSTTAIAYDFKGIEVGSKMSLESIENTYKLSCMTATVTEGFYCSGDTTILEKAATMSIFLNTDYSIESIRVVFDSDDFDAVKSALIKKFGNPKTHDTQVLQNAMGAKFIQKTAAWYKKSDLMVLSKYSDNISEGLLLIHNKVFSDKAHKAIQKQKNDI